MAAEPRLPPLREEEIAKFDQTHGKDTLRPMRGNCLAINQGGEMAERTFHSFNTLEKWAAQNGKEPYYEYFSHRPGKPTTRHVGTRKKETKAGQEANESGAS